MNNKGQSLISFVLIIPVILLILFMVYDIGNMILLRLELDNINYLVIDYGLDKLDDTELNFKLNEMIKKNKDDIDVIRDLAQTKWINNEKTTIVILQLMPNNRKIYSQIAERIITK